MHIGVKQTQVYFKDSTKEKVQTGQMDEYVDAILCFDEADVLCDIV